MSPMLIRKAPTPKATANFSPQDIENNDFKRPPKGQLREPGHVLVVFFVFKD